MKRFFLIVSLAACVLLVGASAFGAWKMEIQDKPTLSPGQTNVTVNVLYSWDVKIVQATLPIVVRTVSGGAFWTGSLPYDTIDGDGGHWVNKVTWGSIVPPWSTFIQEMRMGAGCDGLGDPYNGTSPDNFEISNQGSLPLALQQNYAWLTMQFDVNNNLGCFEMDTACYSGSLSKIFMIDNASVDHGPTPGTNDVVWDKGEFCMVPNPCPLPGELGSYPPSVSGNEQQALSNAWNGTGYVDPDAPRFYLQAGDKGSVNPTTGLWSWTPACGDAGPYTIHIEVADAAHEGGGVCSGILTFTVNVAAIPVGVVCPANVSVHFGVAATGTATATTTCIPVTFSSDDGHMLSGGAYSWATTCQDLGAHVITVTATDVAQRTAQCTFGVTVTNTLPVCNVPNKTFLFTDGYNQPLAPVITDPDGDALTFSNLTITPTPSVMPTLVAGVVTWSPAGIDAGTYTLTVDASDGCQTSTCTWELTVQFVQAYKISILDPAYVEPIDPADHYVHTLNGRNATVAVHMMRGFVNGSGAFDFLICYDQSVLAFKFATKGAGIAGWEYFTYRYGPFGNACGGGCPSGYIRLIGIRDMNNGVTPPAGSEFVNGFVALLTFYVSEDRSLIGLCPRIGFCSIDCGDNTISDKSGNKLALPYTGQDDPQGYFITFGPDYDPAYCLAHPKENHEAQRFIYFDPGFICIIPPPDDRGDINLNGIANEVADAVLFTNYFIYGPSVWDPVWFENQILATDINDDGHVTTVADLVYLIRIITGDAQPFPASGEGKLNPYAVGLNVTTEMVDGKMVVTTNSTSDLGAGYLVFRYTGLTISEPSTGTAMTVKSHAENGEFRVLVYSMSGNRVDAGVTELVSIPVEGNGAIELADAQFSDAQGALMTVDLHSKAVPTTFELMQNYPNPFNASTVIRFALPVASNWTLNVYNVAGQVVKTFGGNSEPGIQSVTWNSDVASGIYFYKLTAGNFNSTKKMVLMK